MSNDEEKHPEYVPTGECYDCGWKGLASEVTPPDKYGFIHCPKCGALSIWDNNANK